MSQRNARLIRIQEVLERTGLSRSSLYRKIGSGDFPAQVRLGDRSVAWVEAEVDDWNLSRPAAHAGRRR